MILLHGVKQRQRKKHRSGFSLTEVMIAALVSSIMLSGIIFLYSRMSRSFTRQKIVADAQSVGSIGFFLIGRDLRRAGSNPRGLDLGGGEGESIPFGAAEIDTIHIRADINGDGDTDDEDEDVIYTYIDNEAGIPGNDTVQRESGGGGGVVFISNVYNFEFRYIMSDNSENTDTDPLTDIRAVRIRMTIGTDKTDPLTGNIITRDYENLVSLRNYQ